MAKTIIVKGFPENLHHRIKVFAVVHNTTMKEVIIEALTEYIDKHEKKKKGA